MIRTQIGPTNSEYGLAKKQATASGISVAEFMRRAARQHLTVRSARDWMKYAGLVSTVDARSSQSIDEIVYEAGAAARQMLIEAAVLETEPTTVPSLF